MLLSDLIGVIVSAANEKTNAFPAAKSGARVGKIRAVYEQGEDVFAVVQDASGAFSIRAVRNLKHEDRATWASREQAPAPTLDEIPEPAIPSEN